VTPKRPAHYLWAVLMARIYEVFPLLCPICGGQMRIIAFITHSADIRHILEHIGVDAEPPRITPARGPPLWDGCDAQMGEGVLNLAALLEGVWGGHGWGNLDWPSGSFNRIPIEALVFLTIGPVLPSMPQC
jgi:hypothetical protein